MIVIINGPLGVGKTEVALVPDNPNWPTRYEDEQAQIAAASGDRSASMKLEC